MSPNAKLRVLHPLLSVAVVVAVAQPLRAEKWPGTGASSVGALAAKAIGLHCRGALDGAAIVELEAYIAKQRAAFLAEVPDGKSIAEVVLPTLEKRYQEKYSDPDECTEDAKEMAGDMLRRVRDAARP